MVPGQAQRQLGARGDRLADQYPAAQPLGQVLVGGAERVRVTQAEEDAARVRLVGDPGLTVLSTTG